MRQDPKNVVEAINMADRLMDNQFTAPPIVEKKARNGKRKPKLNGGKKPKKDKPARPKNDAPSSQDQDVIAAVNVVI